MRVRDGERQRKSVTDTKDVWSEQHTYKQAVRERAPEKKKLEINGGKNDTVKLY